MLSVPVCDAPLGGRYFPCSVAALRTCKSEVLVGVDSAARCAAEARAVDFMTSGEFGVLQFHERA